MKHSYATLGDDCALVNSFSHKISEFFFKTEIIIKIFKKNYYKNKINTLWVENILAKVLKSCIKVYVEAVVFTFYASYSALCSRSIYN